MQIFVDADACPVVGIVEKVAKEHSVPVTLLHHARDVVSVNALRDASIRMIQILQLIKLLPQI